MSDWVSRGRTDLPAGRSALRMALHAGCDAGPSSPTSRWMTAPLWRSPVSEFRERKTKFAGVAIHWQDHDYFASPTFSFPTGEQLNFFKWDDRVCLITSRSIDNAERLPQLTGPRPRGTLFPEMRTRNETLGMAMRRALV